MLRVLHVGKYYPPVAGGMERAVEMLCRVSRGRLQSRVLAFDRGRATREDMVDGIAVTRVGTLGQAGSVPIAPTFASHLRRADADLMIIHEPNPWALLSLLFTPPRLPFAIWFHSDVVRPELQYRLFYAPLARPAYSRARRFVVSSPALASMSPALSPYSDKTAIIPFGIDPAAWTPDVETAHRAAAMRTAIARPIVLFLGRLVAYKGVGVLIKAASSLPVHVVIAGDGPMRNTWMAQASAAAGRATFDFPGPLSDADVKTWMHAADALVLPSITRAEAFGVVQLEAMASGTPVISTNVPSGVPWVNRHGETGLVVAPGDESSLRGAIETLVGDGPLRSRLGAAGIERVRSNFTLDRMADRFVALCREIANAT
ncbi:MAG: glycosyltransferase [Vicinamibacterales bacterium]